MTLLSRAALALALLAACGDDDAPAIRRRRPRRAAAPTAEAGAFPVTIEHKYGTTTIEAAPERVVVAGLREQDALLALGVVPVATTEWFGKHPGAIFPWATDELGDGKVPTVLASTDGLRSRRSPPSAPTSSSPSTPA